MNSLFVFQTTPSRQQGIRKKLQCDGYYHGEQVILLTNKGLTLLRQNRLDYREAVAEFQAALSGDTEPIVSFLRAKQALYSILFP